MKKILVNSIDFLRKVNVSDDFNFLINNEINLYVCEDKISSLVLLEKTKPPFTLSFDEEININKKTISSRCDFEIIIESKHFSYFSLEDKQTQFAVKGKIVGVEKIEKDMNAYDIVIGDEICCSGKLEECIEYLEVDNNKLGTKEVIDDFKNNIVISTKKNKF